MDPMKKVISSFMLDINEYLSLVEVYGKPNHKYFNFVSNRIGLFSIFVAKNEIFKHNSVATQFVDRVLVGLKKKFLSEESKLKRAALVFLMCKIYFTDDLGNLLKLRVTHNEWNVFAKFIDDIMLQPDYENIRVMFYHLFTESFFKFTMTNKALALDYGTVENENEAQIDVDRDGKFWQSIRRDVEVLKQTDVKELIQLNALREEAMRPYNDLFPEKKLLTEALNEFEAVKAAINEPTNAAAAGPSKVTRKEVTQACKDFLKSSGAGSYVQQFEIEEIEWDSDTELEMSVAELSKRSKKTQRRQQKSKREKKAASDFSDSDSGSEKNFKKMNRTLGYATQNVMFGIGAASNSSEKLKKCYGVQEQIKKEPELNL